MKNDTKHQENEPKKMFFDSDGFNFCIKCIIELFKIGCFVFLSILNIIFFLMTNKTDNKKSKDSELSYIDDEGHGHARNGDIK